MSTRRASTLRCGALAIVVGVTAIGCSISETLPPPDCERGGSIIIAAQSVPTGTLVPCIGSLPDGWNVASVWIDHDGTTIRLDSDRAGADAATLRYDEICDLTGAISVLTDQEGAERHDEIERLEPGFRAHRLYVFEGGCVWWEFDFDDGAPTSLSIELGNELRLVSRASIEADIRATFVDEKL